jgi:hypothetical protein
MAKCGSLRGDENIEYVNKNVADNFDAATNAMLCVNDLDGVSALLKKRLLDPDLRTDALKSVQSYPSLMGPTTAQENVMADRWRTILERADVLIAIDAVGRIEAVPIPRG